VASSDDGAFPEDQAGVRPRHEDPPAPPGPPDVRGRVHLVPTQVAGLVMVGLMPVLSLFGLFGLGHGAVEGTAGPLNVRVEYTTVHRLKVRQPLVVHVTNVSDGPLGDVELRLSRAYVAAFADVNFTPAPDDVTDEDYVFELTDLPPGETRTVVGEMQATGYWRREGAVTWSVGDEAGGPLAFATFVWP
jgi:hypothetical protein